MLARNYRKFLNPLSTHSSCLCSYPFSSAVGACSHLDLGRSKVDLEQAKLAERLTDPGEAVKRKDVCSVEHSSCATTKPLSACAVDVPRGSHVVCMQTLVPAIEGQQDIVKLLDANYAMIAHLVRLRVSRLPGAPSSVERRLMRLVEENLSLLVASQKPSTVVSARTAQAARALMRHSSDSERRLPLKPQPPATVPATATASPAPQ